MVPATYDSRSPYYTTIAVVIVIDPRLCAYQKTAFLQMIQEGVSILVINDHETC